MSYVFHLTAYEEKRLLPQVADALKRRTELLSRESYPGLWKQIDRINAARGGKKPAPLRTKVLSALCLALGLFLFIPGLLEPQELRLPLLAGAVGIGAGLGGFYRLRKAKKAPKPDRFTQAAQQLLAMYAPLSEADGAEVVFSDEAVIMPSGSGAQSVPYESFGTAMETEDALLLVFGNSVMLLQKKDLSAAHWESFRAFLTEKIPHYE